MAASSAGARVVADAEHSPAVPAGDGLPVLAPPGASPALASQPSRELDHAYHAYESNPAPWWLALLWVGFLIGGAGYLVLNLMQ